VHDTEVKLISADIDHKTKDLDKILKELELVKNQEEKTQLICTELKDELIKYVEENKIMSRDLQSFKSCYLNIKNDQTEIMEVINKFGIYSGYSENQVNNAQNNIIEIIEILKTKYAHSTQLINELYY